MKMRPKTVPIKVLSRLVNAKMPVTPKPTALLGACKKLLLVTLIASPSSTKELKSTLETSI